jgi:hypothetical protein
VLRTTARAVEPTADPYPYALDPAAAPGVMVSVAQRHVGIIEWIFRIAVFMEFVGHGAFGVITKQAWLPYFAVFGIPEWLAWKLMPVVGTVDITLGILSLVFPIRAVLLHMSFWGLMTATLRPFSGEGIWELLERGYNYGVPFAFLLLAGFPSTLRGWVERVDGLVLTVEVRRRVALALRWAIGLALIGHGGIALFGHEKWVVYFGPLGLDPAGPGAVPLLHLVGWFEMALGAAVLAAPVNALLLFVFLWKTGTEALRIPVGEPIWEFIERGGAYAAPLLLILLKGWPRSLRQWAR